MAEGTFNKVAKWGALLTKIADLPEIERPKKLKELSAEVAKYRGTLVQQKRKVGSQIDSMVSEIETAYDKIRKSKNAINGEKAAIDLLSKPNGVFEQREEGVLGDVTKIWLELKAVNALSDSIMAQKTALSRSTSQASVREAAQKYNLRAWKGTRYG